MEFTNLSPSRNVLRTPLRGYPQPSTPPRPRLPSQAALGRSPSQSTASPQRTTRVTSARYFPYGRKVQTPGEYERLRSRRRDYLKEWETEQDLAEIEGMSENDEEGEDIDDDLAPLGYSSFSFSNPGEESPQVVYEKKWHVLVMAEDAPEGSYTACITFADFPWPIDIVRLSPSSLPISPANFAINRVHMHAFLYNPSRLSRRNMTFERQEEEEKFRWDLRVIENRILSKVIPEDRAAVREACAIVSANLYGLPTDDLYYTGAKERLLAIRNVQYSQKKRGFDVFLRSLQKEERRQMEREKKRQKEMARIEAEKYRTPVKTRERVNDDYRPSVFTDTTGLMGKVDLFGDYVD